MAGITAAVGKRRIQDIHGHSSAAVSALLQIGAGVVVFPVGNIIACLASAGTAGTGAGDTVLDILLNGTSIFTTAANRPTLLATSTGAFANTLPDTKRVVAGDRISLICLSVSGAGTGHAKVAFTVVIEQE